MTYALDSTKTLDPGQASPAPQAEARVNSPYKGLNPYAEADARIFFGRESKIQDMVNHLLAWRLTILYGKSGVGKSSILRAGVTHYLNQEAEQNHRDYGHPRLAVVVFPSLEGSLSWKDDPLVGIKRQIQREIQGRGWGLQPPDPQLSFLDTLRAWTEALGGETGEGDLYLVLDQFEEYLLYHSGDRGQGSFYQELARVVTTPQLRVNVLIAIRQDSLASLDSFKPLIPHLMDHRLQLGHLSGPAAQGAICQPITWYNQQWGTAIEVDPDLVEQVLQSVEVNQAILEDNGQAGRHVGPKSLEEMEISTPYLQLVMDRLWREEQGQGSTHLRLATLAALGGAPQIVRNHLNSQMDLLSPPEQHIAAQVFQYLITPSGTKYACSVTDLMEYTTEDATTLKEFLEKLASGPQRILRPVGTAQAGDLNSQRYEIFHDALGLAILTWRRQFQNQEKTAEKQLQLRQKLSRRWSLALLAILGFGFLGLGAGWYQFGRYQEAKETSLSIKQALLERQTTSQLNTLQLGLRDSKKKIWGTPNQEVAAAAASLLQQTLPEIHLKNQWLLPENTIASSSGRSPDGRWFAAGSLEGKVFLWGVQDSKWRLPINTGDTEVTRVEVSNGGSRVVTVTKVDNRYRVKVWTAVSKQLRELPVGLPKTDRPPALSLSPDGRHLAIAGANQGGVQLWNVDSGRPEASQSFSGKTIARIRFSPDGQKVAIATRDGEIILWNLQERALRAALQTLPTGDIGRVSDLRFSPNGKWLATASDRTPRLWNLAALVPWHPSPVAPPAPVQPLWQFQGHQSNVLSLAFSGDSQYLATGSSDGTARVWRLRADPDDSKVMVGTEAFKLTGHDSFIRAVGFAPDQRTLTTLTQTGTLNRWDLSPQPRPELFPQGADKVPKGADRDKSPWPLTQVAFSPDGQRLATFSLDDTVRLWDGQGKLLRELATTVPQSQDVRGQVFFSQPDGQALAAISRDGTVERWNLEGEKLATLWQARSGERAIGLDFRRGSSHLATLTTTGKDRVQVTVRSIEGDRPQHPQSFSLGNHNPRWAVAEFSPNGRYLAVGFRDGDAYLIPLLRVFHRKPPALQPRQSTELKTGISSLRFSPDGQTLAVASWGGTVQLWNLKGQQMLHQPINHGSPITSVRFNQPRSRREPLLLVTLSWNQRVRLWDSQGNPVAEYRGETGFWDVGFSPEGDLLAVGSDGKGQWLPVKSLDQLVKQGCDWIADYRQTHPEATQDLQFCDDLR
ncbi:MAG: WD40 repeat domain-containing protein [Cyanobacteriota bacterium]|nr:WD40 repeat domain-containing protein [Cyanobacteriota bacterium]